jgi:hypothetical protein
MPFWSQTSGRCPRTPHGPKFSLQSGNDMAIQKKSLSGAAKAKPKGEGPSGTKPEQPAKSTSARKLAVAKLATAKLSTEKLATLRRLI